MDLFQVASPIDGEASAKRLIPTATHRGLRARPLAWLPSLPVRGQEQVAAKATDRKEVQSPDIYGFCQKAVTLFLKLSTFVLNIL